MNHSPVSRGKWQVLVLVVVVFSQLCHHSYGEYVEAALSEGGSTLVDVDYDEDRKVAVVENMKNGAKSVQAYYKNVHVAQVVKNGVCYVTKLHETAEEGDRLFNYLKYGSPGYQVKARKYSLRVLDDLEEGSSLIPREAEEFCFNGYKRAVAYQQAPLAERRTRYRRSWLSRQVEDLTLKDVAQVAIPFFLKRTKPSSSDVEIIAIEVNG